MPTCITSVVVDRSPDEVFAYVADVRRHGEWSPKAYRVEGLAEGPIGAGTTFRSYGWLPGDKDHMLKKQVEGATQPARTA